MMSTKISFSVPGIPPKKDGANSMWRKPSEIDRIKSLRLAAQCAMQGQSLAESSIHMELQIYADPADGDLDNFITGVCDSLMAAHPRTPINDADWNNLSPSIRPSQAIVYDDDRLVQKITVERVSPNQEGKHYIVTLEFD